MTVFFRELAKHSDRHWLYGLLHVKIFIEYYSTFLWKAPLTTPWPAEWDEWCQLQMKCFNWNSEGKSPWEHWTVETADGTDPFWGETMMLTQCRVPSLLLVSCSAISKPLGKILNLIGYVVIWGKSLNHTLRSFGVKIGATTFVITKASNDRNYFVDKKGTVCTWKWPHTKLLFILNILLSHCWWKLVY